MTEAKRKEKINELMNKISLSLKDANLQQGFEIICKRIAELEKENEELKAQINLYSEKVGFWEKQTKLKEAQLEEYDRLAMFDIARTDELRAQIEKMKCCDNCKYYDSIEKSFGYPCKMEKHYTKPCDEWELAE